MLYERPSEIISSLLKQILEDHSRPSGLKVCESHFTDKFFVDRGGHSNMLGCRL